MTKLTKTDIGKHVAEELNITNRDAERAVTTCFAYIAKNMADGNRVSVNGFGTFETRKRAARTGANPKTKEPIEIPASTVPAFKPSKTLKSAVNGEDKQ